MRMVGVHGGRGSMSCLAATPSNSTSERFCITDTNDKADDAVPPGTACQHCSSVMATRIALTAVDPDCTAGQLVGEHRDVGVDHQSGEFRRTHLRFPAQRVFRFGRVAE